MTEVINSFVDSRFIMEYQKSTLRIFIHIHNMKWNNLRFRRINFFRSENDA